MIIQNNTFQPHVTLKSPPRIWNVEKSPKKRKNFSKSRRPSSIAIATICRFNSSCQTSRVNCDSRSEVRIWWSSRAAELPKPTSRVRGFSGFFLHTHAYAVVVSSFSRRDVTPPRHTRFANVEYGQEKWTYRGEWFKLYLLMTNLQYGANVAN